MKSNYEIKCRISNAKKLSNSLKADKKYSYTVEKQTDVYFKVRKGRLKLRIINDEKANLIFYYRKNTHKERVSRYVISATEDFKELMFILKNQFDVLIKVEKIREIFISDNVRIHVDKVKGLGKFVEIEIIYEKFDGVKNNMKRLIDLLGLERENFIKNSYSDLLIKKNNVSSVAGQ